MDDDFDGSEVIVGQESKPKASPAKTDDKKKPQPTKKITPMSKEAAKKAFEARLAKKAQNAAAPAKEETKEGGDDAVSKRKRKRENDKARKKSKTEGGEDKAAAEEKKDTKPVKKTPPEVKQKKNKEKREPLQEDDVNPDIAQMNPTLISDYIAQQIRKFDKDLSSVELEERYVPARYIYDTEKLPKERTLKALPKFLQALYAESSNPKNSKTPGNPHTIVITGAAIRAVEFRRGLFPIVPEKQHSACTKLFSKHIRLADALSNLKKYQSNYAIGTPHRILDCIINNGPLKMDNLKWIILDMSRLDGKGMNVFEYQDILKSAVDILKEPEVRKALEREHGAAKIVVY